MADPQHDKTEGAPPRSIHVEGEEKKTNWLAWLLLGLGLLALLFALSRCNRNEAVVTNTTNTVDTTMTNTADPMMTNTTDGMTGTTSYNTSTFGSYLGGTESTPRTFAFEKLNFDSGKSVVRAEDAPELTSIAATLKQYPNSRIRVLGYADARGSDPANAKLGADRAAGVKAALVKQGIDGGRIETATGGENDPIDSNATAGGQAENRRTEIVVTQR